MSRVDFETSLSNFASLPDTVGASKRLGPTVIVFDVLRLETNRFLEGLGGASHGAGTEQGPAESGMGICVVGGEFDGRISGFDRDSDSPLFPERMREEAMQQCVVRFTRQRFANDLFGFCGALEIEQ